MIPGHLLAKEKADAGAESKEHEAQQGLDLGRHDRTGLLRISPEMAGCISSGPQGNESKRCRGRRLEKQQRGQPSKRDCYDQCEDPAGVPPSQPDDQRAFPRRLYPRRSREIR